MCLNTTNINSGGKTIHINTWINKKTYIYIYIYLYKIPHFYPLWGAYWYYLIWKLSRDDSGMVQDIFRNHFGVGNSLKSQFWIPKQLFFFFFEGNLKWRFSKNENFSFWIQHRLLSLFPTPKWFLNISWTIPESSQLNFHIRIFSKSTLTGQPGIFF